MICDEVNDMGEVMKKGVFLAKDVASIKCAVEGSNPSPVIVRVAKTVKTKVAVAMPASGKKPKTSMTYFAVFPEQPVAENYGRNVEPDLRQSTNSGCSKMSQSYKLVMPMVIGLLLLSHRKI